MTRERMPTELPINPGHATVDVEHPEHGVIQIDGPLAELVSRLWTLRIQTGSCCQGCACGGERHLTCESDWAEHATIDFDWEDGTKFLGYLKQVRTDRWHVSNWYDWGARREVHFPLEDVPRIIDALEDVDLGHEVEPYIVRVRVHAHDPDLCLLAVGNVLTVDKMVLATNEKEAAALVEGIGVASARGRVRETALTSPSLSPVSGAGRPVQAGLKESIARRCSNWSGLFSRYESPACRGQAHAAMVAANLPAAWTWKSAEEMWVRCFTKVPTRFDRLAAGVPREELLGIGEAVRRRPGLPVSVPRPSRE